MSEITIKSIHATAVNVPMARPLVTGGGAVGSAPLVLITLKAGAVEGFSYVFCYTPAALAPVRDLIAAIGESLARQAVRPLTVYHDLRRRFRLIGNQGLVAMACAGIDMALWDVAARDAGLPLYRLLGAAAKPVPAYNSNGLGIIGAKSAAAEAVGLADPGFHAIKVRLGYATVAEDLAVVQAVRESVGEDVELMVDYNQCLSVTEAQQRMRTLDDSGIHWLEEPTLADDFAGHHRIREAVKTPVQLGENCWGPGDMMRALQAGACDYFMPDAVKIGGVSGWVEAAALGETFGVPLSSHLYPEISAHLLAATPTAHWLEYVDWAEPVLTDPVTLENGAATASERPGTGIEFDPRAAAKYAVSG